MTKETVGNIEVDVVEFDQELFEKNIKENDFSAKETYEGKDGKGADEK